MIGFLASRILDLMINVFLKRSNFCFFDFLNDWIIGFLSFRTISWVIDYFKFSNSWFVDLLSCWRVDLLNSRSADLLIPSTPTRTPTLTRRRQGSYDCIQRARVLETNHETRSVLTSGYDSQQGRERECGDKGGRKLPVYFQAHTAHPCILLSLDPVANLICS